jgi:hypothetical protein
MARQKPSAASIPPKTFAGLLKARAKPIRELAHAIRELVYEERPDAEESFYGGRQPMAIYRTVADVCWIQPLTDRCNLYFLRGPELTDDPGLLEGTSSRNRHVKIQSVDHLHDLPVREWLRQSVALNVAAIAAGLSFDEVHERPRGICLKLPQTKETFT